MTGEPLSLQRAELEDLDALLAIERSSFSHPWTPGHFRDALRSERVLALVLRGPSPAGDAGRGIRAYCIVETVADEAHIHDLAVHPDHRRRGIGGRLLGLALDLAARRGAAAAFLEVRRSNWPALALYRSRGFEVLSARRDYYTRPSEDALVLRRAGLRPGPGGNP